MPRLFTSHDETHAPVTRASSSRFSCFMATRGRSSPQRQRNDAKHSTIRHDGLITSSCRRPADDVMSNIEFRLEDKSSFLRGYRRNETPQQHGIAHGIRPRGCPTLPFTCWGVSDSDPDSDSSHRSERFQSSWCRRVARKARGRIRIRRLVSPAGYSLRCLFHHGQHRAPQVLDRTQQRMHSLSYAEASEFAELVTL